VVTPVVVTHSMRVRYNFGTTEGKKERLFWLLSDTR
jgi:hypothetical protein